MEKYVLICCIVDKGYSDLVMSAARENGARGGTVIGARGTGNVEIEKFYGVVIKPDKEMVLILVNENDKEKILTAVGKECGLDAKGQGIAFALPVSDSVGLFREEKVEEKKSQN